MRVKGHFKEDVVLDPFAGIGTVGEAAVKLGRRFVLIEQDFKYLSVIRDKVKHCDSIIIL